MNQPALMNIVYAGDYRLSEQIITSIKSICCHDSHVHFYLIQQDFPEEWFAQLNQHLAAFNSQIFNVRLNQANAFERFPKSHHVDATAMYYRFFIPEFLTDRALYLDADTVVHGSLRDFYFMDLQGNFVAAVSDHLAKHLGNQNGWVNPFNPEDDYFNSGVLLIDVAKWREFKVLPTVLGLPTEQIQHLPCGDQDILNLLFKNNWLKLHRFYNYQVGADWVFERENRLDCIEDLAGQLPLITHFVSGEKPWKNGKKSRLREWYWHYFGLDWGEIQRIYRTSI